MNNSEELKLLIIFSLLAAANLLVLFCVLFFKKNNVLSNKILGLLVLIPSAVLIINPVIHSGAFSDYLFFVFLSYSIAFLFGPLLLFYIHLVQGNSYRFKLKDLLHFHPVFIIVIYAVFISVQSDAFNHNKFLKIVSGEDVVSNLIFLAQLVHFTVYITWSIRKVNSVKTKSYMSIADKTNYKWLKFFVTRLLYLNVLILIVYVVQISFFPSYLMYSDLLATPLVSSCFYPIIVYKSLTNKVGCLDKISVKKDESNVSKISVVKKEEKCDESLEELQLSSQLILEYLKTNKTYLNPDYTIFDLSTSLKLPQRIVSDCINQIIGKNFSDLINDFRIGESKVLLVQKSEKLTIDAIAEMSGFKSRATFYRVFKDKTKFTPAQYVKQFKSVS